MTRSIDETVDIFLLSFEVNMRRGSWLNIQSLGQRTAGRPRDLDGKLTRPSEL
jgi:hypothetical protein